MKTPHRSPGAAAIARGIAALLLALCIPAQAQAPAAAPQTEFQKWLADLDAPWQAAFKRDVSDAYTAENDKLRGQYVAALEAGLTKASGAGDLNAAVVWRNEQKRFAEANGIPAQDDAADALPVKQLRAAWRSQLPRIETDRATRAKALLAKYDQVLAQAQAQLTQGKRIDDALLVKAKRDEVARAWLAGIPEAPPSAIVGLQPKPPTAIPATTPNVPRPTDRFGAKPLKERTEILPFVREYKTTRFKTAKREVPDELRATVTGEQIQISGTKKTTTTRILGREAGHIGKLCLISSTSPMSGSIVAKIPEIPDGTYYGISLDLTTGLLESVDIKLEANIEYEWATRMEGTKFILEVTKQGQRIQVVQAEATTVKGFGFYSTVRNPGSKSDVLITASPAQKQK